jgi:hypothetical protein
VNRQRFHLALGVAAIAASVRDYSARLGCQPEVVVDGEYALWRTDALNVSIRRGETTGLRHVGWEDGGASAFARERDTNGIIWEHFSADLQRREISTLWPQDSEEKH